MKHNVEIYKLVSKVPELCYDDTAPPQMKKTLLGKQYATLLLIYCFYFWSLEVRHCCESAGKIMPFIGSSLVSVQKIRHLCNGVKIFDTASHHAS